MKSIIVTVLFQTISCNTKTLRNTAALAYKSDAQLGEGAFWNHETNKLFWVDIEGKALHIYNPKTNTNLTLKTPSRIGTVVPTTNQNEALIALENGVAKINLTTSEIDLFSDMKGNLENSRLNDGKCDPSGRFWVGSMHLKQEKDKANLYKLGVLGSFETMIDSVTISNGIVWTSDKKTMYYIDTPTSQIKSYNYNNDTGEITDPRVAIQIPENLGYPDGMTIDEEDMLWVGMWNGNAVIRFNPKTGKVLQTIKVPAHNITSCAFGGENLETLYITSAKVDMSDDELIEYPLAGSVFKIKPGVKGVKSTFFKETM